MSGVREVERSIFYGLDVCLACGVSDPEADLHYDHFFPRVMAHRPMRSSHPLRGVVHSASNIFVLCREHHTKVDNGKINTFRGNLNYRHINPVGLVKFLMECYPITRDPRYFEMQVGAMIEANEIFMETVLNLTPRLFKKSLIPKYLEATVYANQFITRLKELELSQLVDLDVSRLVQYTH